MESIEVPRTPGDADRTLEDVLEQVRFQNSLGNRLVSYSVSGDTVNLEFEPPPP